MASNKHSLKVGKSYIVRTVTSHQTRLYTGKLKVVTDSDIVLADAAWIADSGRWADALSKGTLKEVEPYPGEVIISRAAIVDASEWKHPLPREQK